MTVKIHLQNLRLCRVVSVSVNASHSHSDHMNHAAGFFFSIPPFSLTSVTVLLKNKADSMYILHIQMRLVFRLNKMDGRFQFIPTVTRSLSVKVHFSLRCLSCSVCYTFP